MTPRITEPVTRRLTMVVGDDTVVTDEVFGRTADARRDGMQAACLGGTAMVTISGADGQLLSFYDRVDNRWRDLCRGRLVVTDAEQTCTCGGIPTVAVDKPYQHEQTMGWRWACDRCGADMWAHRAWCPGGRDNLGPGAPATPAAGPEVGALPVYPPAPPPAKKRTNLKKILAIAAGGVALCCVGTTALGLAIGEPEPPRPTATTPVGNAPASPGAVTATAPATVKPQATPSSPASPSSTPTRTATPTPSPKRTAQARPRPTRTTVKPTPTRTTAEPEPTRDEPEAVYYKNCAAVRAAGKAPIRRGQPGYGKHLDRDGDGQGCGQD